MQKLSPGLLVALAFFSSVAPFGIDMYLPGMPSLASELGASPAVAQLTITGFMLGMAVGNLLFGAISDGTGRKPQIVGAASVFLAASVLCAVSPSIWPLVAARFVQGLAAGSLEAVSRAVVADVSKGRQAARALRAALVVLAALRVRLCIQLCDSLFVEIFLQIDRCIRVVVVPLRLAHGVRATDHDVST